MVDTQVITVIAYPRTYNNVSMDSLYQFYNELQQELPNKALTRNEKVHIEIHSPEEMQKLREVAKRYRLLNYEPELPFAKGGKVKEHRPIKVRFHLGRGKNFMKWKIEDKDTGEIKFLDPDDVQLKLVDNLLTNRPTTAKKIFTGAMNKAPIAWIESKNVIISEKPRNIAPVDQISYNPRRSPNWTNTAGDNVDKEIYPELITYGRKVYLEQDGKLFELGGFIDTYEDGGEIPVTDIVETLSSECNHEFKTQVQSMLRQYLQQNPRERRFWNKYLTEDYVQPLPFAKGGVVTDKEGRVVDTKTRLKVDTLKLAKQPREKRQRTRAWLNSDHNFEGLYGSVKGRELITKYGRAIEKDTFNNRTTAHIVVEDFGKKSLYQIPVYVYDIITVDTYKEVNWDKTFINNLSIKDGQRILDLDAKLREPYVQETIDEWGHPKDWTFDNFEDFIWDDEIIVDHTIGEEYPSKKYSYPEYRKYMEKLHLMFIKAYEDSNKKKSPKKLELGGFVTGAVVGSVVTAYSLHQAEHGSKQKKMAKGGKVDGVINSKVTYKKGNSAGSYNVYENGKFKKATTKDVIEAMQKAKSRFKKDYKKYLETGKKLPKLM